ncbi:uncharacterized protein LOC128198657 [Bicyclus anynana]|uniref:Uncharacterized protein LOC128198657 n=1 Tax=Bicyclus anynana TaxID=110368 RepID=A0ABM3LPH0_BICAN|nr:uncharacterized protein LOC128198657 [Bicyclus anynana]
MRPKLKNIQYKKQQKHMLEVVRKRLLKINSENPSIRPVLQEIQNSQHECPAKSLTIPTAEPTPISIDTGAMQKPNYDGEVAEEQLYTKIDRGTYEPVQGRRIIYIMHFT